MFKNPFSDEELSTRLANARSEMAAREIDIALISTPENIFYLTGLDHWGYFAPHLLIVPADGEMTLVTRAMERVTIEAQVRNALFKGHADNETAADVAIRHLNTRNAAKPRLEAALEETEDVIADLPGARFCIGVETWSSGLAYAFGAALRENVPADGWIDITGLVDKLRLVKSPEEQKLLRATAKVSDAAAEAAIAAISAGAREADVAAECVAAMIRAGGQPPGFGPFIRPAHRLGEEHTTWGDGVFEDGKPVFLEITGCVSRYHAPLGRLVHVGNMPEENARMAKTTEAAFQAVLATLKPGALAREVYAAWQKIVDDAGLPHYRRHHCGYCIGIGFPPSWTGGNTVTGLRHDSELEIQTGMSFHILSWLMGTGRGDFFLSNCVLLGENGPEVLTKTSHVQIR
ncbi:MAG: Xaa-Pro peptidase family protein [Gammaproteobacteria bacterium]|nr:Xaa-Pro peptidase family protein [Gammaproteobacteria bacterium]